MTVTVEKLDNNEVKLSIEVDSAVSSFEYEKACKRLAKRVNVPGFRPGRAPKTILEKYVGIAALQKEVLDSVLPTIIESAIEENNFDIITTPNIDSYEFSDDKSLKATARFELKPEVNLPEYTNLTVEIEEYKTPENSIDEELRQIAERFAELKDVEGRKSINTDLVNIDFNGYVDGEEIKGGSAKNYVLDLGHSNFIDGFAQQLVDHEKGEEFKIQVKFPEEYHDEKLKGKDAEFNIKINAIKERILPEINDDLAKRVNPSFASLDDMKKDIQTYLDAAAKAENDKRKSGKIFDTLLEQTNINIQDNMINREIQALMGEYKQRINMQGGDFDKMLEKEGHQKIYAQLREEAIKRIKTTLIIGKIAENEKITIERPDIEGQISALANLYRTSTAVIVAEMQKNPNILNSMNQRIVIDKVTKFLLEKTNVTYKN